MDAIALLKRDHDTVRALFKKYDAAGDRAFKMKRSLVDEISEELRIHAEIEEKIFYPAVKAARSEDAKETVREGIEEHTIVKRLLAELSGMEAEEEQFDAKVKVLTESVEHHAGEEEKEMFREAKEKLGTERLRQLGAEMERLKVTLKSSVEAQP